MMGKIKRLLPQTLTTGMMGKIKRLLPQTLTTGMMIILLALAVSVGLFLTGSFEPNTDNVTVPVERIPAYHIIKADEFITKDLDTDILPSNAIDNISSYVNYCTLGPLEADKAFSNETLLNLENLTSIENATVMGISATLTTSLGGKLEKGDVTDLIIPSFQGKEPLEIRDVQILDIIGNASDSASAEFTIVVVLPRENASQIINETDEDMAFAIRTLEVSNG